MSDRLFEQAVSEWLETGSDRTPPPAIDAVLLAVKTTPQERDLRIPRRFTEMALSLRLAAAIAIVAVVGIGAMFLIRGPGTGVGGTPTPSPTVLPMATTAPTTAAQSVAERLDITKWTAYVSSRYGFSIARPVGWTQKQVSDHDWTLAADHDWQSTASEGFVAGDDSIYVTAWSVAVPAGTSADAWILAYCQSGATGPCTGLKAASTPVTMDGHPGVLINTDDTEAFTLVGRRMYVVALWESFDDPRTTPYGGADRLVQSFLSTVHLLPGGPATPSPTTRPS
jgi:hypothetical protein